MFKEWAYRLKVLNVHHITYSSSIYQLLQRKNNQVKTPIWIFFTTKVCYLIETPYLKAY